MKNKKTKIKILILLCVVFFVSLFVVFGVAKINGLFVRTAVTQSNIAKFKDKLPDWASNSINRLSTAGIINGYSNGNFGSGDNLTRGQVVTLLYRTLKYKNIIQDPGTSGCPTYSDVKTSDYYSSSLCFLALNNADIFGVDGTFSPNVFVKRGEVAKLIDSVVGNTFLKSMGKDREASTSFQDVSQDNAYFNNVGLMKQTGIMLGKQGGSFDPNGLLNRAEMAVILDRTLNLLETLKIKELTKKIGEEEYLEGCADLIDKQTNFCSQYQNWLLDIQVYKKDMKSKKKAVELNSFIIGPGNKCNSDKAGEVFPAMFKSAYLDNQEFGGTKDLRVVCKVTCTGWNNCPVEQEMSVTCTGGAMSPSDCLSSCDGTCEDSQNQAGCSICVSNDTEDNSGDSAGDSGDGAENSGDTSGNQNQPTWYQETIEQKNTICTGEAIKSSDCLKYCDGTCQAAYGQSGCSVCVQYGADPQTYSDPGVKCGAKPVYDCTQCNGLPSYPTFEYEDCLTACNNSYQNAAIQYNACLGY